MKNIDIVKFVGRILEFAAVVATLMVFVRLIVFSISHMTIDFLGFLDTTDGRMVASTIAAELGLILVPGIYLFLWLHRLDKWLAIRKLNKQLNTDNQTLEIE
ncbi:hypothetical protein [Paenibacillus durus]|nr:hypothetical protein [Paenibacillus durus]